jgi:hypothetical protein
MAVSSRSLKCSRIIVYAPFSARGTTCLYSTMKLNSHNLVMSAIFGGRRGQRPAVAGSKSKVVALCMSDEGMPETEDQRMAIADKLVNGLVKNGVPIENIYVDLLVQPVATNNAFGVEFLQAIERIIQTFKGVHTMCGLSNISFGLPEREFINQTFMVMVDTKGVDGAIVNPLDARRMACIQTAEKSMGRDAYCKGYLKAFRAGKPVVSREAQVRRWASSRHCCGVHRVRLVTRNSHALNLRFFRKPTADRNFPEIRVEKQGLHKGPPGPRRRGGRGGPWCSHKRRLR